MAISQHYIHMDLLPAGIFHAHCRTIGVAEQIAVEINSPLGTTLEDLETTRIKMIHACDRTSGEMLTWFHNKLKNAPAITSFYGTAVITWFPWRLVN